MANITQNLLTSDNEGSAATVFTTASIAPAGNNLVLLTVVAQRIGGDPSEPTVAGNGLTWVKVATQLIASTNDIRVTLFRALGAAPSSGTVVITYSEEQNNATWIISEFANVDTGGSDGADAVVQSVTNVETSATPSVTLAAFGNANNATFGCSANLSQDSYTPGSGFAEIADLSAALAGQTQWRNDNDTSVDWSASNIAHGMIACEIKNATQAITATVLASAVDATDLTVYTTASQTPSANRLVLAVVSGRSTSGFQTPTLVGNGLTWVLVEDQQVGTNGRLSVFRAMGSSPSTGTVVITHSVGQFNCGWIFVEFDNVVTTGDDGADAVVQSADNSEASASTISVTLASFGDTENATFGAFADVATGAWTPGTGFTELADHGASGSNDNNPQCQFRKDNDTSVDATNATSSELQAIALEIAHVSTASGGTSKAGTSGHLGIMLGW